MLPQLPVKGIEVCIEVFVIVARYGHLNLHFQNTFLILVVQTNILRVQCFFSAIVCI